MLQSQTSGHCQVLQRAELECLSQPAPRQDADMMAVHKASNYKSGRYNINNVYIVPGTVINYTGRLCMVCQALPLQAAVASKEAYGIVLRAQG